MLLMLSLLGKVRYIALIIVDSKCISEIADVTGWHFMCLQTASTTSTVDVVDAVWRHIKCHPVTSAISEIHFESTMINDDNVDPRETVPSNSKVEQKCAKMMY